MARGLISIYFTQFSSRTIVKYEQCGNENECLTFVETFTPQSRSVIIIPE